MKKHLNLNVNGQDYEVEVEANRLLLQVLRDSLDLTGTKEGCSIGVCGACSVIVDGRLVSSCLTLAAGCEGKKIETIEGLERNGRLHLRTAFIEHDVHCERRRASARHGPLFETHFAKSQAAFRVSPPVWRGVNRSARMSVSRSVTERR